MDFSTLLLKKPTASLIGLGRSNTALAAYLSAHGIPFTVREARPFSALGEEGVRLARAGVQFFTGDGYLDRLTEEFLFLSPVVRSDLSPILEAARRGATVTSETALYSALTERIFLGVTGSDGKTTTATLAHLLLKADRKNAALGGNIGKPLISFLDGEAADGYTVAELSSFQLMTEMRPPRRAVITNLTPNHLNWHRDYNEYVEAKLRILGEGTAAVLPADDSFLFEKAKTCKCPTLFSLVRSHRELAAEVPNCHTVTIELGDICIDGVPVGKADGIAVPGRHNRANFLAALGLVYPYVSDIKSAFSKVAGEFHGVAHRLEFVGEIGGVRYYNSSIDSTPSRTAATLEALGGCSILLCGGADKGVPFTPLLSAVNGRVRSVILFGAAREKIADALANCQPSVYIRLTFKEAVEEAKRLAREGDTVLLSPACTSFDEFRDFEERGECFRRLIYEK